MVFLICTQSHFGDSPVISSMAPPIHLTMGFHPPPAPPSLTLSANHLVDYLSLFN